MKKTIALNDYQINLLHSLLVNEEINLSERIPIVVIEHNYKIEEAMDYVREVESLRRRFTKLDDGEDYQEVFSKISDYKIKE